MCAIIDANVAHEAFGTGKSTAAGRAFREAVDAGRLLLVVGGRVLDELDLNQGFRQWRAAAAQFGRVRVLDRQVVDAGANQLRSTQACQSNDEHVVALAQVSGARLLFTNDHQLQQDFRSKRLIDGPRGSVYTTRKGPALTGSHRRLLANRSLCASA